MAPIPLVVAYLALPLTNALTQRMGPGPEASPYLPWLILAGLGSFWAMLFRRSGVPVKKRFFFEALAFLGVAVLLFLRQDAFLQQMELALPYAWELAPAGILGFSLMWSMTFGVPDRDAFQGYGAALAVLCVMDLATGVFTHHALPVQRLLGDADMLAGLLLVSLCAGLRPGRDDHGVSEPDQGHRIWRVLILLGLAACLSRTGLFGAGWIFLFFGRGSRLRRILVALILFLLLGLTFVLPYARVDGARYIDYWFWAQSVALYLREPGLLLTGLPLDQALPFAVPPELTTVWERVTATPALFGAHLFQVKSFWLRVLLGWGALIPLGGLTALFFLLFRRMTHMGAGLAAALFAQGMSTPLFHDPALGAPFGLALILALSKSAPLPGDTTAPDAPEPEPGTESDPARQWDMGPL
ncbi:hypothetical protein [Pseudodesulfovibrio portus]|uniref:O-antigen polymerase n=1 Tax=Pseudodesulfovibrio portus TaxID=231439 RepID=A0ABM8ARK8_9BACT|nr:hypothetical protein [Pseudodesulfovibrio portus]BDQ34051.1 hypothetical protein JCM14722_15930 [Pseudodesulfovibrio portus]